MANGLPITAINRWSSLDPSYHHIPADIAGLLLNYLPMHTHHACFLVPCLRSNPRVTKDVSSVKLLKDAIIKHDLEFFVQSWIKLALTRYDQPFACNRAQNSIFIIILLNCWRYAFKYARLAFLDVLLRVDRDGFREDKQKLLQERLRLDTQVILPISEASILTRMSLASTKCIDYCDPRNSIPTYAEFDYKIQKYVYEEASNAETIKWILANCVFEPGPFRDSYIMARAIDDNNILILDLLYMSDAGFGHNRISYQIYAHEDCLQCILDTIKNKPIVLKWFRSHAWHDKFAQLLPQ
jgi:hypothetical protein